MIGFIELYISGIIMAVIFYFNGKVLFDTSDYKIDKKSVFIIVIFSLFLALLNSINSEILHGIVKITVSYIAVCIYYKFMFKKIISDTIIAAFFTCLLTFISETVIALILSLFIMMFNLESMLLLKNTILINLLICLSSYLIIFINRYRFCTIVKNNELVNKKNILIILLILLTISMLGFRIPLSKWNFNIDFIFTMAILFSFCVIGFMIIKQKSDIQKTTSMYQRLAHYSDITNGLLEDYKVVAHEHKNQLLIIRSMIEENKKEVIEYLDNLLDKRSAIKYVWVGQLNYLSLSGLKGLINYKLMEMESLGININICISSEISKTKLDRLSTKQKDELYSIIGVYLDNAIQAANGSKGNEISLEIYKEKKDIVVILANTYNGKINLEKLDDYGYTTKGKNHGIGLHIVKKILDEEKIFSQSRKLFQNYYVQELRIHLDKIKQKKKKQK